MVDVNNFFKRAKVLIFEPSFKLKQELKHNEKNY